MIVGTFEKTITRYTLLSPGMKVLVALSGGADSVCLLHLLLEIRDRWRLRIETAHFNHCLRGRESDEDALFSGSLSRRLRLPFHAGRAAKAAHRREERSLQEAARDLRFDFLLELAERGGFDRIALGHHGDDQAETMVMRFIGGSGPAGLGGIPPSSHGGRVIHPQLDLHRSDIERYLKERKIPFRTDRTNRQRRYLRNRVRLDVIPCLKGYNPSLATRLGELAELFRLDQDLLDSMADDLFKAATVDESRVFFPSPLVDEAPRPLLSRAILKSLRKLCPSSKEFGTIHIKSILEGYSGERPRCLDLPGGITAFRDDRGLELLLADRSSLPLLPFSIPLKVPGTACLPSRTGKISATVRRWNRNLDLRSMKGLPLRTAIDWDALSPPLTVRRRLPGDRFRPLGMKSEKKLKDFLIDEKVPRHKRDMLPLVCDGEGIIWVAGVRISDRCRVGGNTRKVLFLKFTPDFPFI